MDKLHDKELEIMQNREIRTPPSNVNVDITIQEKIPEQQEMPFDQLLSIIKNNPDSLGNWEFANAFRDFIIEVLCSVKGYNFRKYLGYDSGTFFYELEKPPYDHYCVAIICESIDHVSTSKIQKTLSTIKEVDTILQLRPIIVARTQFYRQAVEFAKSEGVQIVGINYLEILVQNWYERIDFDDAIVCSWIEKFRKEIPHSEEIDVGIPQYEVFQWVDESPQKVPESPEMYDYSFEIFFFSLILIFVGIVFEGYLFTIVGFFTAIVSSRLIKPQKTEPPKKESLRSATQTQKQNIYIPQVSEEERKYREDVQKRPTFAMTNNAPNRIISEIGSLTSRYSSQEAGNRFEEVVCIILKGNGFSKANQTPKSGDYGADIIACKYGKYYAIQCKCYHGTVSNHAVQEVYSGKTYYKCDYAVVATNSTFSANAIKTAKATCVILWSYRELSNMISNLEETEIKKIMQILQ